MAIARVGQYPFEQQWSDERGFVTLGSSDTWSIASTGAYTGAYGLYDYGRVLIGAFGFAFPPVDDVRAGWYWNHDGTSDDNAIIKAEKSGLGYSALSVFWKGAEYSVQLYSNNVLVDEQSLWQFPHMMIPNTWAHHGIHYIGGSRFVYTIDGVTVFDYSDAGIPTAIEGIFGFNTGFSGWNPWMGIDDFYCDTVVGESLSVPPSYRFLISRANSDGTTQDWTAKGGGNHVDEVDDTVPDDDSTVVWTTTTGHVELFNTTNVTIPVDHTVTAAIPWVIARKGNAVPDSEIRLKAYNGSAKDGSDQKLPTWYYEIWERFDTDPSSAAWDETSFNANEFGFETRGTI